MGKLFGLASFKSFVLCLSWEFLQNLELLKVKTSDLLSPDVHTESQHAAFWQAFKKIPYTIVHILFIYVSCIWTHYLLTTYST